MVVNLTTQYITHRFGTIYRNFLEGKKDGYTISITKADGVVLTEKSRWSEK
jgi:hypothetical protein